MFMSQVESGLRVVSDGVTSLSDTGAPPGERTHCFPFRVRCRIQKREANDVNPNDYLADVRLRVQTHPATRIDALSPQTWKPTADSS